MADKYSNPDPRLHVDYLINQYKILQIIKKRKIANREYSEAIILRNEQKVLFDLITTNNATT